MTAPNQSIDALFGSDSEDDDAQPMETSGAAAAEKPAAAAADEDSAKAAPAAAAAADDDDDDDDDDDAAAKPAAGGGSKKAEIKDLFGSDDDDDDDDDDDAAAAAPAPPAAAPAAADGEGGGAKAEIKDLFGSDDSDDDDGEAEHVGGVVEAGGDGMSGRDAGPRKGPPREMGLPHKGLELADPATKMMLVGPSKLMAVETKCFDEAVFDEDRERSLLEGKIDNQVKRDNMIRWRYKTNEDGSFVTDPATGEKVVESNARFVRWSDGSLQLWIGNSSVDVVSQKLKAGSLIYKTQKAVTSDGDQTCLSAHAALSETLKFRPSSLKSKAHRELTLDVRQKHAKHQRLKTTVTMENPEKKKEERARQMQEMLRSSMRMRDKERHMYATGVRDGSFLEYDDEDSRDHENSVSLKSIKGGYGRSTRRGGARKGVSPIAVVVVVVVVVVGGRERRGSRRGVGGAWIPADVRWGSFSDYFVAALFTRHPHFLSCHQIFPYFRCFPPPSADLGRGFFFVRRGGRWHEAQEARLLAH